MTGKGKGKQGKGPAKQSIVNKHAYQRMNYLYQASQVMIAQKLRHQNTSASDERHASSSSPSPSEAATLQVLDNSSRRLNSALRNVAQRMQIRLSTDIKRSLCRDCDAPLQPATGNSITCIASDSSLLEIHCAACKRVKRFPLQDKPPRAKTAERDAAEGGVLSDRAAKRRERRRKRRLALKEKAFATRKALSTQMPKPSQSVL